MIIRRRHTKNFTTLSNVIFDDMKLQADEVGVLAYLLSRPHDWEIRRSALMRRWSIGPGTMKRIVNSWMKAGWCQATKIRLPNGTFCILYDISDLPGKELSDDEIRMALSLVSSEVDPDGIIRGDDPDEPPSIPDDPPPSQPVLVDHGGGEAGVAYRELPNTELPRTNLDQNSERELARAREKHAINLAEFKRRWPTIASDDQTRVDNAWFALSFEEGDDALAGITPFLENQKRLKKTHPPAGFNYLGQKRWTLLEAREAHASAISTTYPAASIEAKAIATLHEIVGRENAFRTIWRRPDGSVSFPKPMTAQLRALGEVAELSSAVLARNQAAAWNHFTGQFFERGVMRRQFREGDRAPHPWPPKIDGTWSPIGAPDTLMTEEDFAHVK